MVLIRRSFELPRSKTKKIKFIITSITKIYNLHQVIPYLRSLHHPLNFLTIHRTVGKSLSSSFLSAEGKGCWIWSRILLCPAVMFCRKRLGISVDTATQRLIDSVAKPSRRRLIIFPGNYSLYSRVCNLAAHNAATEPTSNNWI